MFRQPGKPGFAKSCTVVPKTPREHRGPEPLTASHSKTLEESDTAEPAGAYLVHSGMNVSGWDELRQLILACENLPAATRQLMIDLGDHAGTSRFAPDGQTARRSALSRPSYSPGLWVEMPASCRMLRLGAVSPRSCKPQVTPSTEDIEARRWACVPSTSASQLGWPLSFPENFRRSQITASCRSSWNLAQPMTSEVGFTATGQH